MNIKMYSGRFGFDQSRLDSGHNTIGGYIKFSQLNWLPTKSTDAKISLFTDGYLKPSWLKKNRKNTRIGLALEPREINPRIKSDLRKCQNRLDLILTHDDEILKEFTGARRYIVGGSLFKNSDKLKNSKKNGRVSMVISDKKVTEGHILRHKIVEELAMNYEIDVFGVGTKPFVDRGDPYSTYSYTIVVENVSSGFFFTEKLIDPLLSKCIPIYWGAREVTSYFQKEGILEFKDISDLEKILQSLSLNELQVSEECIRANQQIAVDFMSKEWNIQAAICKELYGQELPKLNSLITNLDHFLAGKASFEEVEPAAFKTGSNRTLSGVGLQSRFHLFGNLIRSFKSYLRM
jgi:hypothetical protein